MYSIDLSSLTEVFFIPTWNFQDEVGPNHFPSRVIVVSCECYCFDDVVGVDFTGRVQ